jgi:hypothetical protein
MYYGACRGFKEGGYSKMIKIIDHSGRFYSEKYEPQEILIDPKVVKGIKSLRSDDKKKKEAMFLILVECFDNEVMVNTEDKDKIVRVLQDIHEGKTYQFEAL